MELIFKGQENGSMAPRCHESAWSSLRCMGAMASGMGMSKQADAISEAAAALEGMRALFGVHEAGSAWSARAAGSTAALDGMESAANDCALARRACLEMAVECSCCGYDARAALSCAAMLEGCSEAAKAMAGRSMAKKEKAQSSMSRAGHVGAIPRGRL